MKVYGPDSRYAMQHGGHWCAVTYLLDYNNRPTRDAWRAAKAVLRVPGGYIAVVVNPGDLVERDDRDPDDRDWEYID